MEGKLTALKILHFSNGWRPAIRLARFFFPFPPAVPLARFPAIRAKILQSRSAPLRSFPRHCLDPQKQNSNSGVHEPVPLLPLALVVVVVVSLAFYSPIFGRMLLLPITLLLQAPNNPLHSGQQTHSSQACLKWILTFNANFFSSISFGEIGKSQYPA